MPLSDQLEKLEKADLDSLRQGYREIIRREASHRSLPDDAAVLKEILTALKKTPADFDRDSRRMRNLFAAEKAADDARKQHPAASAALAQANAEMESARKDLFAAQQRFDSAFREQGGKWNLAQQLNFALDMVRNAQTDCKDLL